MNKIIILLLILLPYSVFSQIPVEIFTGKTEAEVREYFLKLKEPYNSNKYVTIDSLVDKDGDLVLQLLIPTLSEAKSNFLSLFAVFKMANNGNDICTHQIITGTDISAYSNVKNIKSNFTKVPNKEAIWTRPFSDTYMEVATFKKEDNFYTLTIVLFKQ